MRRTSTRSRAACLALRRRSCCCRRVARPTRRRRRQRRQLARPSASTRLWVIVAGVLVMFMQAGLRVPGDRLLARQERRHGRREDPHELLDRRDRLLGRAASPSPSAGRRQRHRQTRASSCADYGDPHARRFPVDGPLRRDDRGEVVLPVRLLRRLAGDRLGHDARADQVRRLHHLRGRLRGDHLPARLALGVRRRLAAATSSRRHAGLRRLHGGPPDRRDRRARGAAAPRRRARASTAPTASRARSPATTCRCSASAC